MANNKIYKTRKRKFQHKKGARTNKKLLTIVASIFAVAVIGLGGMWYLVEYRGAERNVNAGDELYAEGEYKAARKQYGRAVTKEPTNLLYVDKLMDALLKIVPVTPAESRAMYDEYVRTLVHMARYNPLDIEAHLRIADEMYTAAYITGLDENWGKLRSVAQTGLDRISADNPRRHELLLFRGIASLRIEDASMTDTYDDVGNVRFPGESEFEEVLEQDPGNAIAWAALAHGRMAVYYRLNDEGKTSQAARNRKFANETMAKAVEAAGDSFEVSSVFLRELILRRTALLQQQLANRKSVSDVQIEQATQEIVHARDKLSKAYDPKLHFARVGEIGSLLIASNEEGIDVAIDVLKKTVTEFPNDFGRQYMLLNLLAQTGKTDEAAEIANFILETDNQPVGLHALELFSIRPLVAQSQVRLNVEKALDITEDEERELLINEANRYRELLSDLVSGQEDHQYLLYADGIIALAEQKFTVAALKLEEVINRNPDVDATVYRQVAFALAKTGARGLAIERLTIAIAKEPSNLSNYLAKARMEIQLSDAQAAATTLSVLSEEMRSREDIQELLNLVAMQRINSQSTDFSDPVLRNIARSEQLTKENKFDEAITLLQEAMGTVYDEDWRLHAAMSNVYSLMDEKELAIEWIQKAIELVPNPAALLPQLHVLQTGNRVDALISLIEAQTGTEAEKAGELAISLYELGMTYLGDSNRWEQIGNEQEAKKAKEISSQAIEESRTYQLLAESLGADLTRFIGLRFNQALSESNLQKAEGLLEELINSSSTKVEIDNSKVSLYLAKAVVAKQRGDLDIYNTLTSQALSVAETMVEETGISDFAWRTLGRVLVEIDEMEEALQAYAEAYRISPRNKENIRRYVGVLVSDGTESQRLLRVLRNARDQYPNDRQLLTAWLEAERQHGDAWKMLVYRFNQYVLHPEDRTNTLELAFVLTNTKPARDLLRDLKGNEVYSARMWEQMPTAIQLSALRDARREWDKKIAEILEAASTQVDSNIRIAHLHASIHQNLGQLERSSEIWDRFIASYEGSERYTTAVIAAVDFLHRAGRTQQAIKLLEAARPKQSERFEIDAVLGSLHYVIGQHRQAADYMKAPVVFSADPILSSRMIESLAMAGQFDEAQAALADFTTTNSAYAEAMLQALINRVKSEQLLAQGNFADGTAALKLYRNALRKAIGVDSRSQAPYFRLCRSLLNEYRLTQDKALLEEALRVAEEANATGEDSEQLVVVRADVLQADGQLSRSIDRLMRFLSDNPDASIVRQRLIEAHLDSDNVDRALAVAQAGVSVDSTSSEWYQRLGDLQIRANNDIGEGVKAYLQAIQLEPSVPLLMKIDVVTRTDQELPDQELLTMSKGALSKLHPIAGAIEAKALQNLGRNRDALLAMERSWKVFQYAVDNGWISALSTGSWFLDLQDLFKDNPDAGEEFVRSLVNGPLTQNQLAGLAGYFYAFGDDYIEKALHTIETGLALPESTPESRTRLLMLKGGYLVEAKRYEESELTFRKLTQETESPLVQNNLAYVVGVYRNNPEEGLKIAKAAAKLAPRSPAIIDTVATMYYRTGEYQKAAEALDYLLQVDPTNSKALAKLSLLYADKLGEPERGIVFAERGRSQSPRSPQVLDALGWSYYKTGRKEQAEETIRRSLRQDDTMEAYLHLAQIVTEDNKFDEALGHLRMAQELAEDEYSLNSIQVLKDDIRKKKADF